MSKIINESWDEKEFRFRYYCSKCGTEMDVVEDPFEELVCPQCGHRIDVEHYGLEDPDDWNNAYPTKEEFFWKERLDELPENEEDMEYYDPEIDE